MKKHLLIIAVCVLTVCGRAFAQIDTTYSYADKDWKSCKVQNAIYKIAVFQAGNLWHKQTIKIADAKLLFDYSYSDKSLKTREDTSRVYRQDTILEEIYKNGKKFKIQGINKEGKIFGYAIYGKNGQATKQKGYDENGKEIANYIFMQEPSFSGGVEVWQQYLRLSLNANVPVYKGAPSGIYRVIVAFSIDENGNTINVKALTDPGWGMAEEAIRVIANAPKWSPAVQYNKYVTYRQKQAVIFNVP